MLVNGAGAFIAHKENYLALDAKRAFPSTTFLNRTSGNRATRLGIHILLIRPLLLFIILIKLLLDHRISSLHL